MNIHRSIALTVTLAIAAALFAAQLHPCAAAAAPSSAAVLPASSAEQRQVAIIIDDFGNDMRGTKEILSLPVHLTIAVMPFMSTTKRDAEWAHEQGHDVIIHMPMEPKRGKRSWLGPNAITSDLSDEEVRRRVEAAIADVPHAVGMNNHMGSRIMENTRIMGIVLQVLKEQGLFFVDSGTSSRSVAPQLAKQLELPYARNQLFFDDVNSMRYISKKMQDLHKLVKRKPQCIAIGHVGVTGRNMAAVLKSELPRLEHEAELVGVSSLIPPWPNSNIIRF